MTLVLLLILQGRTSGGHGLLEAVPRIYQVTPDLPDRRRATKQKEVRPSPADSLNESQLAARSGPAPSRRTSPTSPIRTASLDAIARPRVVRRVPGPSLMAVLPSGPLPSPRCHRFARRRRRSGGVRLGGRGRRSR